MDDDGTGVAWRLAIAREASTTASAGAFPDTPPTFARVVSVFVLVLVLVSPAPLSMRPATLDWTSFAAAESSPAMPRDVVRDRQDDEEDDEEDEGEVGLLLPSP